MLLQCKDFKILKNHIYQNHTRNIGFKEGKKLILCSLIHRFLSLANINQVIKASIYTRNSVLSIERVYLFSNFVITCTRPRYFVSFARNQAKPYKFDRFSNLWINTGISWRKKVCSSIVCDYCLLKFMFLTLILSVDTEKWLNFHWRDYRYEENMNGLF